MKKLIAALTLTLALAGCQSLFAPSLEDKAWLEACNQTPYCAGVTMPQVVQSDTVFKLSWYLSSARGVFFPTDGEDIVFIRGTFEDDDQRYITLVHEMTHYIDLKREAWDPLTEGCKFENHAFEVGDRVADKLGRPDLKRPEWYKVYPTCTVEDD